MKHGMIVITIMLSLFIVGCGNTQSGEKDESEEKTANSTETEEGEKEQDQTDETESTSESEEVSAESEEEDATESEPNYKINENWSIVPIDDAEEKVVLLTIDDAPDKKSLDMAKTLKKLNVPAIFFVNGHFLEGDEKENTLKEIHEMDFIIGNHTYSHAFLPDLGESEQEEEIIKVNDMVEDIIGERPRFFRAPNGANTDYTRKLAKDEKMTLMNWSYGYDWESEYQTKEAITDIMINTELLTDGANLLMHDRDWTAEALEDIVKGLREKGYEFVDPHEIETE